MARDQEAVAVELESAVVRAAGETGTWPHRIEVRAAPIGRQDTWETTPHPRLDGRTPLDAVQAERLRAPRDPLPMLGED